MKKLVTILILLSTFLFTGVEAQSSDNAIFFKISGHGLKKPSYILGSLHIMRGENIGNIPSFEKIFKEVSQVCFETDMNHHSSNTAVGQVLQMSKSAQIAKLKPDQILLPNDSTYEIMIGEAKAKEVDSVMKIIFPNYVTNMRPEYTSLIARTMYSFQMLGLNHENIKQGFTPIDYYVHSIAVKEQKKVEMLEPFIVQDSILKKMSLESQPVGTQTMSDRMNAIYDFCHSYTGRIAMLSQLKKAYSEGRGIDVIDVLQNNKYSSGLTSRLMDVRKRNASWMQKIPQMIKKEPTLIVVGLAHLMKYKDSDGLISDLRKLGYKVEPVK